MFLLKFPKGKKSTPNNPKNGKIYLLCKNPFRVDCIYIDFNGK